MLSRFKIPFVLLALILIFGRLDTTRAAGSVIAVPAGGNFQAALNAAQPGDTITLAAGATYTGPFRLPPKSGNDFITIRTSAPDSSLPPAGSRINPSYANVMPKIVGAAGSPVIITDPTAHHFQFIGVEIAPTPGAFVYNVVQIGDSAETNVSVMPHDFVFDRVYIHGEPAVGTRRGIAANGARITIINSHISDFKEAGADTQAIACWTGTGPLHIENNYLEGAGENILIGGMDPRIVNLVPSDITVRGNHFYKPTSWRGSKWVVKNLFELKNAKNVVVDGNVFENNWAAGQSGFAILFTTRNQDGTAPWSKVENVQFTNNIVRHVAAGLNILANDDNYASGGGRNFLISNNLFEDVSAAKWGGSGRVFQILNGAENLTITHNTGFADGATLMADMKPTTGFVYENNLTTNGQYGVIGSAQGIGTSALSYYFPGYKFTKNAIIGGSGTYPADNFFPASVSEVQFQDYSKGNYKLLSTSTLYKAGTDGKDIGVNTEELNPGVVSSNSTSTAPPPTTPPPTTPPPTTEPPTTPPPTTPPPTTPPPIPPLLGATTRVEQNGAGVTYSGTWLPNARSVHSGGTASLATEPNARASFAFNGTAATWIAYRDAWSGIANVYVDGTLKGTIDTYSSSDTPKATMYTVTGLSAGSHTLVIEVTGKKNASSGAAWIWIDAFDVASAGTTPGTSNGGNGGTPPTPTTPGTGTTSGRTEQGGNGITYTGTWLPNTLNVHSGSSAVLGSVQGSRASFTFNGTGVTWIAYGDEWSGIANVYVDGTLKQAVDTYSAGSKAKASMYSVSGLAPGNHTLVIEVTGSKNASSGGAWVWIDAFDVTSGGATTPEPPTPPTSGTGRTEQTESAVQWSGTWSQNNGTFNSGSSANLAMNAGSRATFTFTGTSVSWIAYHDEYAGIARVYVDGALKATVDTYASPAKARTAAYSVSGLSSGTHTIAIEATGTKSASSRGAWIWVDAFDHN